VTRLPSLGGRGEGWFAGQVVVFGAVALAGVVGPAWPTHREPWLRVVALASATGGAALFVDGIRRLGSAASPFPRPVEDAAMREDGVYRLVRHPVYGGVLLLALAWSSWTSPWALGSTAVLALLFEGKRRREEVWLREAYPGYDAYAERVRRRFVPLIW
jgi:protein-S-isoprenylcysteine O-methyltransferase Ste14